MAGKGSKPGERRGGRKQGTPNRIITSDRLRVLMDVDPVGQLIAAYQTGAIGTGKDKVMLDSASRLNILRELRRIAVPDAKSAPVTLTLPPITTAADVVTAIGAVIAEMAKGALAPDEAQMIAGILEAKRKAIETTEIEARLTRLETAQGGKP